MALYLVLKHISHFLPVKQQVRLDIKCAKYMKFEELPKKSLTF